MVAELGEFNARTECAQVRSEATFGRRILKLFESAVSVNVFWDGDSYALRFVDRATNRPKVLTRETLPALVAAALGIFSRKKCLRCNIPKILETDFARDVHSEDGFWRYCKVCERERVRSYGKRRRREAEPKAGGRAAGRKANAESRCDDN